MRVRYNASQRTLLISLTVFVWVATLAASIGRFKLKARHPTVVELTTWPPSVRISIDGEAQFGGNYVLTPIKLELLPGRRRLTLSRDGYFAQSSKIEAVAGKVYRMENVVLQRQGGLGATPLRVEADDAATYEISINNGFAGGSTPLLVEDLRPEVSHTLAARRVEANGGGAWHRCRFTLPKRPDPADAAGDAGDSEPHEIRLKVRGTRLSFKGCERLRPSKP